MRRSTLTLKRRERLKWRKYKVYKENVLRQCRLRRRRMRLKRMVRLRVRKKKRFWQVSIFCRRRNGRRKRKI
jgi:hypothetical protein